MVSDGRPGLHEDGPGPAAEVATPAGELDSIRRARIELAFAAKEDFTNPTGNVLGAFVAAMLYDTVGLMHDEVRRDCHANEVQAIEKQDVLIG